MQILDLKIENYRNLNFYHDFSEDQFIVLTGVNGSGKSTIIEAVETLLSRYSNQIPQFIAEQFTNDVGIIEITLKVSDEEIDYLAERVVMTAPDRGTKEDIYKALTETYFVKNKYKRRLEILKPQALAEWNAERGGVKEYINDSPVDRSNLQSSSLIMDPNTFNIISQEMLIKIDQLENMNLQFTKLENKTYSLREIFQPQNQNEQSRSSRTNISIGPLLQSKVKYESIDDTKIQDLLNVYNEVLSPIKLELVQQSNGIANVMLKKNINSSTFNLNSASSGQKKAFALTTIKYVWEQAIIKPIVLIDEPENSLHPGLTKKVFEGLSELINTSSLQPSFIIGTHSPEVVASIPNNTFRINTHKGNSTLNKVVGLESRAKVIKDLGVYFNLDYVAQKIVFVESTPNKKYELSDQDAYQRLIDPLKEEVLFISVGSSKDGHKKYEFQHDLFLKLNISEPDLVQLLVDRDENKYDESKHTPFRHIEYLYIINQTLIARVLSEILLKNINKTNVKAFFDKNDTKTLMNSENFKEVWKKLTDNYKIQKKTKSIYQGKVVDYMYEYAEYRTEEIQKLIDRFRSTS